MIKKLKVATGGGSMAAGSHFHVVEMDMINSFTARSLLWNLPRQGPTKRGQCLCWNCELARVQRMCLCPQACTACMHRALN